jgi:hypothetical protein
MLAARTPREVRAATLRIVAGVGEVLAQDRGRSKAGLVAQPIDG